MPDLLTLDLFLPHLHETFMVQLQGIEPIPLELVEASPLPDAARGPEDRKPFSLLFLGPVSQQYLRQSMYHLEHSQIGALDIFIVPLGFSGPLSSSAGRMQYQAIFN